MLHGFGESPADFFQIQFTFFAQSHQCDSSAILLAFGKITARMINLFWSNTCDGFAKIKITAFYNIALSSPPRAIFCQ